MKYNHNGVVYSGRSRTYTVKRSAREAMEIGELKRRWNDNEFSSYEYPIRYKGKTIFSSPKKGQCRNSWEYEITYQGNSERAPRTLLVEAVCQDHATSEAISRVSQDMWTGMIPLSMTYNILKIKRTNHRQSSN